MAWRARFSRGGRDLCTGEDGVAGDAHAQSKGRARRVVDDEPFVGGELGLLRVVPGAVVRGDGDQEI